MKLSTKKIFIYSIVIALLGGCIKDKIRETEVSFSEVTFKQQDSVLLFSFNIINTGENNLVVDSISADCSCTDLSINKKEVSPKQNANVTGRVNISQYYHKDSIPSLILVKSNSKKIIDSKKIVFVLNQDATYRVLKNIAH